MLQDFVAAKKDDSAWGSASSCCWFVFERSVKDTTAS